MSEVDWDTELDGKDIDDQWKSFYGIVLNACLGNAPTKRCKHKMQPNWCNAEAKRSQARKYAMWEKIRDLGDYESRQEYKYARNSCNEVYRKALNNFEEKLAKN